MNTQTTPTTDCSPASVVHCIGDSHVCFFSGDDAIQRVWAKRADEGDRLPWFKTYRIGSSLAYNLTRCGTKSGGRERLYKVLDTVIPPGAHVLLSFGEIDCRAHVVKQARAQGLPVETVVERCLDQYFTVVGDIVARGFQVIVYNVVPSRITTQGGGGADGEVFVTTGTWQERNHAARLFNEGARRRCAVCGARFLENYPQLVDEKGKMIQWYFWDSIHLSQRAMPATLEKFRALCPELGIPPQRVIRPGWLEVNMDVFRRRLNRVGKEIRKLPRIFGAS